MMDMIIPYWERRPRPSAWRLARGPLLAAALALAPAGCSDVLEVDNPDVATPGALEGEEGLPALLAGALSDFQVAYSGSNFGTPLGVGEEGQINYTGLFTDEFLNAETFPTRIEVDQREISVDNSSTQDIFNALQRARASAERAGRAFAEFGPDQEGFAEVLNLAGFSYILFGENYCSGVPYSTLQANGEIAYGQPQTTEQTFEQALAKFDSALTVATAAGSTTQQSLAQLGRGRTLLDQGRFADAAAAVAGVTTDFAYLVEHSENSERQNNGVWEKTFLEGRWTVSDNEGINGLPFVSAADPRAPTEDSGETGFDGETPLILQLKYPERDADAPLATGIEARLIEAEAVLQSGDAAGWLAALNALRADPATGVAGLTPLTDPGTPEARQDLHFRERAFWLWLTAHRLGDMRRLVRQYGRAPESVYPTGEYHKGGLYGSDYNFPIPTDERNNPNLGGGDPSLKNCIDRSP